MARKGLTLLTVRRREGIRNTMTEEVTETQPD